MFIVHVIDDDDAVRESLDALLTVAGYVVVTFSSGETYLAHLDGGAPDGDCALLDIHMPGIDGMDLLRILVVRRGSLPVLVLSASHDERLRDHAISLGAVDCLKKPVHEGILLDALEGIRQRRLA